MTTKDIKKYQIECDFCEAIEVIERAERGFLLPPKPKGWKTTYYRTPQKGRFGRGRKSIDHCPKCFDEEIDFPDDAMEIYADFH